MKTRYKDYLLALSFLMVTALGFSQIENMDWSAKSLLVSIDTQDVEIKSNLSKTSLTFTWEQVSNLSTHTMVYSITSSSGSWDTQQQTGQLNYTLTSARGNATLVVLGTEDDIAMTLTAANAEGNEIKTLVFTIETFQPSIP